MKTEMLDNLLDIEIAYSLSKSADNLDEQYKRLKTDIEVLLYCLLCFLFDLYIITYFY